MAKIDNEAGACDANHVSPTVANKYPLSVASVHALIDTDAGPLPGARNEDGAVDMRDYKAVQADKQEY